VTSKDRIGRIVVAAAAVAFAGVASAQYPPPPQNWANAPTGKAAQPVFPYPGQCSSDGVSFGLPLCTPTTAPSFLCDGGGFSNQSAASKNCGSVTTPPVNGTTQLAILTGDTQLANKYAHELLNPLDYTPDTAKYKGADYYEIAVHESWGYQAIATAGTALGLPGLFPDPTDFGQCSVSKTLCTKFTPCPSTETCTSLGGGPTPNGQQWTGITDSSGKPLNTPIWGVGQVNMSGGPITATLADVGTCSLTAKVCFVSKPACPGGARDLCKPTPLFNPRAQPATSWSRNNFVSTWPSISIRGKAGTPVVVKWINEFPNNHLFCPHPEAADWPCAIDRTFMGVKASINPTNAPPTFQNNPLPYNAVNQYGSPMQPDNSWVTHLHGGEIPPQVDGFAEKWFGNAVTGRIYSPQPWPLDPVFNAPPGTLTTSRSQGPAGPQFGNIFRPGGPAGANPGGWSAYNFDTYAYPMVNRESTIWFHDHTLGKTHHNVIAGPAGFFPVIEPAKHGKCVSLSTGLDGFDYVNGLCPVTATVTTPATAKCVPPPGVAASDCEYSWIDPVTDPRGALGIPKYDLFLAIQDRDFNSDGTINFPNGMANTVSPPASGYTLAPGNAPVVPGPNPQVHPAWVPEYFASNAVVNGVIWPKKTVEAGWYRIRIVDGSDARCYNIGFSKQNPVDDTTGNLRGYTGLSPTGANPLPLETFNVVANEQGYLKKPVKDITSLTMCPGERYELLVNFGAFAPNTKIYMVNDAAAPFPGGAGPFDPAGIAYRQMATIMRFDVTAAVASTSAVPGTVTSLTIPDVLDQDYVDVTGLQDCTRVNGAITNTAPCIAAVRNLYLNERIDGTTGASMGLQINGVPFEYDVTETPVKGTYERWNIVNLTVDAHPMHPHLGKFQIVGRKYFDVTTYRLKLCQGDPADSACTPGTAPGGVMQLIPDPGPYLLDSKGVATPNDWTKPEPPDATEGGWKDAMRAMPGMVTSFVGKWDGGWISPTTPGAASKTVTAPGAGNTSGVVGANAATWVFPDVTSGPYVWHCHINSHEDSEMMRSSLVVAP
jgi:FtsP/CotA-like multicopper oxidase with cupredoxin domain